jgi:hypothetical protein
VHLVFDWQDSAKAPAACTAGEDKPAANLVGTLWTDDGGLAASLRGTFGAPAFESPVEESATELPGGHWDRWSWGPDGSRSSLGVLTALPDVQRAQQFRAFWPAGDGVGRLDLGWTATTSADPQPAQGSMRPPMLAGDFTGLGQWFDGYEASGRLALFQDAGCQQEVMP